MTSADTSHTDVRDLSTDPDALLSVTVDVAAGTVELAGELDIATAPLVEDFSGTALARPSGDLQVCLRDLRFVDSAGAAALATLATQARARGRRAVFVGADDRVVRVLRLAGYGRLLEPPTCTVSARRPPAAPRRADERVPVVGGRFYGSRHDHT